MNLTSRAVATAALTVALSASAVGAQAAGNSWKTLSTSAGGKVQACKVATTATGPWKVKLRVDATRATTRVNGSAYVYRGTKPTKQTWKSGWVAKGHVSAVGSVRLPRGKAYSLNAGIGTDNMGNGGTFTAGQIRGC